MTDEASFVVKSICLDDIERKADWCKHDAEDMLRYANLLVSLPNWAADQTEAVLQKSIKAQIEGLQATIETFYMVVNKRIVTPIKEIEHAEH